MTDQENSNDPGLTSATESDSPVTRIDFDLTNEAPSPADFTIGETYSIKAVIVDSASFPGGKSLIGRDNQNDRFRIGVEDSIDIDLDLEEIANEEDQLLVITNITFAREGKPLRFTATETTAVYDPRTGRSQESSILIDVSSDSEPTSDAEQNGESESTETKSQTKQQTLPEISGEDTVPSGAKPKTRSDSAQSEAASSASSAEAEEKIDPVSAGITPGQTTPEYASGFGTTTFVTRRNLSSVSVSRYEINVSSGAEVSDNEKKQQITYDAARAVRNYVSDSTDHPPFEIAVATALELVSTEPLPVADLQFESLEDVIGLELIEKEEELQPNSDARVLERLLEERLKRRAALTGFQAPAVNRILSSKPYDLDVENTGFKLYDRFHCTIQVAANGQVYLHVNPRTRIRSYYTLDELQLDRIKSWARVITTYSKRGYRVIRVGPEHVTDQVVKEKQMSIPEYFRAPESPNINEDKIRRIEQADRPVVWATKQGTTSSSPVPHAPKLLALQGHTENLDRHAADFYQAAREKMYRSPQTRLENAVEFANRIEELAVADEQLPLNVDLDLFRGDGGFRLVQLFENDEEILEFANGITGTHPSRVERHGVYQPPDPFRICYLYPEQFDRNDKYQEIWQTLEDELEALGAPPDTVEPVGYTAKKGEVSDAEALATRITTRIDPNEFDALFGLLPADNSTREIYPTIDPYDPLKRAFGSVLPTSQMAHWDHLKSDDAYVKQNTALGLIAAAGGVPYAAASSMPEPADVFIGVDAGQAFRETDQSGEQDGIRIGASATVALGNGALIGHTNTGAQSGERIPPRQFVEIVRDGLLAAENVTGDKPDHAVIHRDGFLYDDTSEVENFLESYGVEYDIVEIRKRAPMRILETKNDGIQSPRRNIAALAPDDQTAYLVTYGRNEPAGGGGVPRPITVERVSGETDIETIARQIYLLSECHIASSNSTIRLPITTEYADRAAEAVANDYLSSTTGFMHGIGFL